MTETDEKTPLQQYWQERDRHHGGWDRELPEWAQTRVNYLRLGFIFLFAALAIGGLVGCSASASDDWRPATDLLTDAQQQTVLDANTSNSLNPDELSGIAESMRVQELAEGLVAVDFNSPLLTGQLGTRFVVYYIADEPPSPVLETHLVKTLPDGFPLIDTLEQTLNGLPCLAIHQVDSRVRSEVTRYEFCYDGNTYALQNKTNLPFDDESGG